MGRKHSNTGAGSDDGIGRRLGLVAQALPLGAVACWVITIFVPVLDSGEPDSMRIRITSLGATPIDMNDFDEVYFALWVVILLLSLIHI